MKLHFTKHQTELPRCGKVCRGVDVHITWLSIQSVGTEGLAPVSWKFLGNLHPLEHLSTRPLDLGRPGGYIGTKGLVTNYGEGGGLQNGRGGT